MEQKSLFLRRERLGRDWENSSIHVARTQIIAAHPARKQSGAIFINAQNVPYPLGESWGRGRTVFEIDPTLVAASGPEGEKISHHPLDRAASIATGT